MAGVNSDTVRGMAEYRAAVIEDMTCCSAQKSRQYGRPIMVTPRTRMLFHWLAAAGHDLFCRKARTRSKMPAATKRRAAARNGGTSWTTTRIASHVLP